MRKEGDGKVGENDMDWIQLLVLIGTMLGTVLGVVIPLHLQTNKNIMAVQTEMKDFHGRLCVLEEKYHQVMMRLWEKK